MKNAVLLVLAIVGGLAACGLLAGLTVLPLYWWNESEGLVGLVENERYDESEPTEAELAEQVRLGERYETIDPLGEEQKRLREMLYEDGDFDAVELKLSEMMASLDDEIIASRFGYTCNNLGSIHDGDNPEALLSVLEQWCEEKPESSQAHSILGSFYIDYGWQYRGNGWANTVSNNGWKKFHQYVAQAEPILDLASELDPTNPWPCKELITCAQALNHDRSVKEERYEKAKAVLPYFVPTRNAKLEYLKPKWGGSWEELEAFSDSCVAESGAYPMLGMVRLAALDEMTRYDHPKISLDNLEGWRLAREVLEPMVARYPDNLLIRARFAYYAHRADKDHLAFSHFEFIGDRWLPLSSFSSLARYNKYRARAYVAQALEVDKENWETLLEFAKELNPDDSYIFCIYGWKLMELRRPEEAEPMLRRSIELDSDYVAPRMELMKLLGVTRRYDEFLVESEAVLELDASPEDRKWIKRQTNYVHKKQGKPRG